jgi:hypothetical protein
MRPAPGQAELPGFQTPKLRVIGGNWNSPRPTLVVWQPRVSGNLAKRSPNGGCLATRWLDAEL